MTVLAAACIALATAVSPAPVSTFAGVPVQAVSGAVAEKRSRTAVQRKIDTQLLYALYRERGDAEVKGVPPGELRVKYDAKRRAFVDIRARVSSQLLTTIKTFGGEVVSSSARYADIRAYLPLGKLEDLAVLPDVRAIAPAEEATTRRPRKLAAGAQS